MPGPNLDVVVQGQQAIVQGSEDPRRAVARLDREIGPRDVADEQRVAGQDGPGVASSRGVAQDERGVLGAVAGRVHRLDLQVVDAEPPAVGKRLVRILGPGELVDVDGRSRGPGQPAVSGDVVRVVVGLEHMLDPDPVEAAQAQVGIDVPLRIDDHGDTRVLVADQIGAATEVLVDDLPKEHQVELQASGSAVSLATSAGRRCCTTSASVTCSSTARMLLRSATQTSWSVSALPE